MTHFLFVDTGAWFAAAVPWDANHAAATAWLSQEKRKLLTTDFIMDETLTLLKARGEMSRALSFGDNIFSGKLASLYQISEADLTETWQAFRHFQDKDWSFTDCSSKVVMEKLGLTTAFSFDQHFRQFGSVIVVP